MDDSTVGSVERENQEIRAWLRRNMQGDPRAEGTLGFEWWERCEAFNRQRANQFRAEIQDTPLQLVTALTARACSSRLPLVVPFLRRAHVRP